MHNRPHGIGSAHTRPKWSGYVFSIAVLTIAIATGLLTGCPSEPQSTQAAKEAASAAAPRPSVALRVLVVNEPELTDAIDRLRGEWAEQSGGELNASAATWADLSAAKEIDADAIIFPSRYLGELCVRNQIRPVRPNVLESKDLDATDFFPAVRHELIHWGGQVMALPLGIDLMETGAGSGHHPAISLLTLAAPQAMSKERLGALFDSETMRPRIAEPPFVDALTQLVQSNKDRHAVGSRETRAAAVLGYSDRLIAVTSSSHNAASAFQLIEWLAQPDTSSQLARAGGGTLPVRRSLATSALWYDPSLSASERAELGKTLEAALSERGCLLIPRIRGVDEYMAALDKAVREALAGDVAPDVALQRASVRWGEVTEAHGRDRQREAYLKHLGL
ncbi:MAG: hypothetical protein WD738_21035 [Pirellulales bacterium]